MKRIAVAILLSFFAAIATATPNYQDWWWNPALSGMGNSIGQQGDTLAVAWYLYDSAENPSFLTLAGPLVNGVLEGTLWRTYGPQPGTGYDPNAVMYEAAGTARLSFNSSNQATFDYDYDGLSGTINLQRFTYGQLDIAGEWAAFEIGTYTGCTDPTLDGPEGGVTSYSIFQSGSAITIVETYLEGFTCTYKLTGAQKGSYLDASGTLACPFGVTGNVTFHEMRVVEDFLTFDYDLQFLTGETCRSEAKVSAIRGALPTGN